MLARVITGVIGVPIAALLVFYPRGLPFAIAIGIVSVLGAMEFYGGLRKTGARPVHWAGLAAIVSVSYTHLDVYKRQGLWFHYIILLYKKQEKVILLAFN